MFNKLIIASAALATITLTSCEKELDRQSFNSVDESVALATSNGVEAALIGAYSRVGDDNVLGGGYGVISELLGAILLFIGFLRAITPIAEKQPAAAAAQQA